MRKAKVIELSPAFLTLLIVMIEMLFGRVKTDEVQKAGQRG